MQRDLRQKATSLIQNKFSPFFHADEIHAMNFWLLDALESLDPSEWENQLTHWLSSLQNNQPIQYIFNRAFFGTLELFVNPNTLIPRPETEELCQLILDHPQNTAASTHSILDIGTGSGCIPVWLKHNRIHWQCSAVDVSKEALEVAKFNAHKYKTEIDFSQIDVLELENFTTDYSIVISNPPYIPKKEISKLNKNVIDFEPHLALFVENNDPLIFYKKIAKLCAEKKQTQQIWLEINPETAEENLTIFNKIGAAQIIIDYSGNPRFIYCQCNS